MTLPWADLFDPFGVMINESLRDNPMGYGHPRHGRFRHSLPE